ncbi:peptidylprolyl isomerase [Candidatus Acetothermia bacterium]|jgi:parvulin-like peptidyl-prolyl isomerase/predicted Zn-dependent protease|nr:peptidylprolyl isomerase [Candidatus Acetothermia bacterium]MCI2432035.1 peptidylprolyl isomerase [Candidatus Acetothermia bacterium]MCI2437051.1 peptidylprolyl isomerase [Candidatus Acetothermia bacterium]
MHTMRRWVERYGKYIIGVVIVSFVIGGVVIFAPEQLGFNPETRPQEKTIVLVVNGEQVDRERFLQAFNQILNEQRQFNQNLEQLLQGPEGAYRQLQWQAEAVNRLTEQILKEQEIRRRGISVPSRKIDERYKSEYESTLIMLQQRYGIDEKELARLLSEQQSSLPAFQRQVRERVATGLREEALQEVVVGPIELTDEELLTFLEENRSRYINEVVGYLLVSDEEIKAQYEANKGKYATPEVKARHILVSVEPNASEESVNAARAKIEEIKKQLDKGADFAELANKYSDDKGNADDGGDLGWFGRGRMVKEFEEAAFALEVGKVSEPVKTQFGFHLIQVDEKRVRGFEEAKEDVQRDLTRQREDALFTAWLEAAKQNNIPERVQLRRVFIAIAATASEEDRIAARKRIQEARDQINTQGKSFFDVVQEYSQDPTAIKERGGDIGYWNISDLAPEIREVVAQLQPGQLSNLIETSDGVYLIRLDDRKTLATIRERVAEDYKTRQRLDRFDEWLESNQRTAKIEIKLPLIVAYNLERGEKIDEAIAAYEGLLNEGLLEADDQLGNLGNYIDYYIARLYKTKLRQAQQEKSDLERATDVEDKEAKLKEIEQKIQEYSRKAAEYLLKVAKAGEGSRESFNELIDLDPENAEAHYQYGLFLFTAGDEQSLSDAVRQTKRAVELAPTNPGPLRLYGHLMMSFKNYKAAIEHYEKALELTTNPGEQRVIKQKLAEAYLGLEDLDKAEALYKELRDIELKERNQDDPRLVVALGDIAAKRNSFEEAIALYSQALKLQSNPHTRLKLGRAYEGAQNLAEAEKTYKQVLREAPYLAEAYLALGDLQRAQGQTEEALKNYREGFKRTAVAQLREQFGERILELDPKDLETRMLLARHYQKERIYDSAVRHYTAILEQEPRPEQALAAYIGLGDIAKDRADQEEIAKGHYKSALKVATTDAQKKNLYEKIIEVERKLVGAGAKLGQDGLEALYQLALLAYNEKKMADARAKLEELKRENASFKASEVAEMLYEITGKWSDDKPGKPVEVQKALALAEGQTFEYNSTPPTSGGYREDELRFGVHSEEIAEALQVYALRGSAVLIQYGPQTPEDIAKLITGLVERLRTEKPDRYCRLIVAPYAKLEGQKIALTAWGRLDQLETYNEARMTAFIDEWLDKGPERAECTVEEKK